MLRRATYATILTAIFLLFLAIPAAAHGGEESAALSFSGRSTLTLSVIASVVLVAVLAVQPIIKFRPIQYGIIGLVIITAIIHILAGLEKPILLLNGLGYLALLGAIYLLPIDFLKSRRFLLYVVLIGYTVLTIILYFASHPWGFEGGSLDRLGVVTKGVEILLVGLVLVDWWQYRQSEGVPPAQPSV